MSILERWQAYRRAQRAALRASNRPHETDTDVAAPPAGQSGPPSLLTVVLPRRDADEATVGEAAPGEAPVREPGVGGGPAAGGEPSGQEAPGQAPGESGAYGRAGRPINRQSPFYLGFVGAIGVLTALLIWNTLGRLTTVMTLLVVALFLTLALNPLVESLTTRGMKRPGAVSIVFAGVLVVFTLLGVLVVPPVAEQGALLIEDAPGYVDSVLDSRIVRQIDQDYQVVDKISEEINNRVTDSDFISQALGGVLGAGRAVLTGLFQFFTVLILTLFFLANLPRVKQAAYAVVPASRRTRVVSLSEEIMRRTGSYAIGQVAVAGVNALCSWLMMSIVGIPYAAVLAVLVGFLGLIPMVGATLGAVLVCTVAVFDEPRKMIIAAIYYVVYQQIENYVVVPKIMQRTVSVPGAVTVVAALAGGTLLGLLGALLAIPFAAGLLLLYEEVLLPRQRRH
jgi:predicted PurR-regulated permease PerM